MIVFRLPESAVLVILPSGAAVCIETDGQIVPVSLDTVLAGTISPDLPPRPH